MRNGNNSFYDSGVSPDALKSDKEKKRSSGKVVIAIIVPIVSVLMILSIIAGVFLSGRFLAPGKNQSEVNPSGETNKTEPQNAEGMIPTVPVESDGKHFSLEDASKLPDAGNRKAMSTIGIASKVSPATVSVIAEIYFGDFAEDSLYEASGSGFIISEDGYVITNYHVIAGASSVSVVVPGYSEALPAEVIGTDSKMDIAVLKISSDESFASVVLGDSDLLQVGELAVAIGNPFGEFAGTVTAGVISALNRDILIESTTFRLIQTDASINNGNSGGPLVNSYGEVIGVTNAKITSAEGIGFAIPINDVKSVVEELINKGYVSGRPILGVVVVSIDASTADQFNWPVGLFVREVTKDGPADKAGLKPEDIITHVNDEKTETTDQLLMMRDALAVGDEMKMTVYRDGTTITVTLILGEGKLS